MGSFSGKELTDQVTLVSSLVMHNISIGIVSSASIFSQSSNIELDNLFPGSQVGMESSQYQFLFMKPGPTDLTVGENPPLYHTPQLTLPMNTVL